MDAIMDFTPQFKPFLFSGPLHPRKDTGMQYHGVRASMGIQGLGFYVVLLACGALIVSYWSDPAELLSSCVII